MFFLPGTTSCFSQLMILFEDDLPGLLTIGQVNFQNYLPSKKINLSRTTGRDFFRALLGHYPENRKSNSQRTSHFEN